MFNIFNRAPDKKPRLKEEPREIEIKGVKIRVTIKDIFIVL